MFVITAFALSANTNAPYSSVGYFRMSFTYSASPYLGKKRKENVASSF